MVKFKQPFRFLSVFGVILIFFFVTSIVWLFTRNRWKRVDRWTRILTYASRATCRALGIRVRVIGAENVPQNTGVLFVGNHLSYTDVVIISGVVTTCFVTSVEIKETPFLGQLCQMAGCLFVERRTRKQLTKEIGELGEGLDHGLAVTVFPEATSTNGEGVLRFRRPLFLAAVQTSKPVVPICLNYRSLSDRPLTAANRDFVFWYGDMPFVSHLWNMCGLGRIDVDLTFMPAIQPKPEQDPTELADTSHLAVAGAYHSVKA